MDQLQVVDEFRDLGFANGDQILKVNGEEPENVLDLNKHLFLRDIREIEVEHADGATETVQVPEEIGYRMWQGGYMEPFTPRFLARVDSVIADSPAGKAGLEKGDLITSIDGNAVQYWDEFTDRVKNNEERTPMEVRIDRDGFEQSFTVVPNENNLIGVYPRVKMDEILQVNHKEYSFAESIQPGFARAYWTLRDYMAQFKYVFTEKGASSLGGFITIGSIFPSKWNWEAFWSITALLSIMLAFMNLLPIPALDGGHVVFTLYEIISGRKPSDKFLENAQIVGFIILVSLLLFANGNDIYKWLTGQI